MKRGEEYRRELKGKKVLVVGLGKSGKAAVTALSECGAEVSVQDSASADKLNTQVLRHMQNNGIKAWLGTEPADMSIYDMIVMSPGVPTDIGFVQKARENGTEIIGELELAYRLGEGSFAAITGTNGKTTTTTLVGEIFEADGRNTSVVGNIGNPVVTASVGTSPDDWLVTEVSSFQLETTVDFRPRVSAILNLTPDHLNRHGTMENYGRIKARIADNQGPDDFLIINMDDEKVCALAGRTAARVIPFSMTQKPECGAFLDGTKIMVRDLGGNDRLICDRSELQIIGDHNVENVLAAAAICFFAGIDAEVISKTVKAFGGVEHRIEYCGTIDGVDYYNDSKGTNVDAAVIAIRALRDRIILIAGGDGKGQDFTALAGNLDGSVRELILLGRDAGIIEECARQHGFTRIHRCRDMPECVRKAAELAEPGDRVLLSPACASWDMYANFEQRGKHFKECLKEMLR
ncbi:MAG: UDP-N-acetylmuramoyl-L-alanine--D-glutamate ligase [Mogibacterium sp.]|nr:UDP-N-acetylmuramoyl-L-alanine--D-glutamate ligase [Mogibacterium sp.]